MRDGHRAAASGHAGVALRHTRQALVIARSLLDESPPSVPVEDRVAALVVSHHNLADLYQAAHLPDQAVAHLCQAHATLMALCRDDTIGTALRQAAWRHTRETHAALLLFLGENGPHPTVAQALQDHANPAAACGLPRH